MLPSLPENVIPKKSTTAPSASEGLELCKQAVAVLVGDMRAEIQQAVGLLKGEAQSASATRNPIAAKLLLVADNLQHAEKDALGKMRELLTHSNWELGQRLDLQMQVNAQLGDHMQSSRELTLDTVTRIEQGMKRLEASLSRETGDLRSEVSRVKEIVTGISTQVERESQSVQRHGMQNMAGFESRLMEQLAHTRQEFEDHIRQLEDLTTHCSTNIHSIMDTQTSLKATAEKMTSEIFRMQQQDDKHYADLSLRLDTKVENQNVHMLTLISQTETVGGLTTDVARLRKRVTEDTRTVLSEITRVQKALQVDYLPPTTTRSARVRKTSQSDGQRGEPSSPREPRGDDTLSAAVAVQLVTGFSTSNLPGSTKDTLVTEPSRKSLRANNAGNGGRSRAASNILVATTVADPDDNADEPVDVLMNSSEQTLTAIGQVGCWKLGRIVDGYDNFFANCGVQTDASWAELSRETMRDRKKKKKSVTTKEESVKQQSARAANLTPMDKLKEKATAAAMKRQYNVQDYYRDDGCAQRVAKSPLFDNLTIFIVLLNSIWLGVDADLNTAAVLWDAPPAFIVAENFFCLYFTIEITIRFLAFYRKLQAFKDFWFDFDFALAILIIVETWITPLVLLIAGGSSALPEGSSILRLIRLARLVRLTRLTRLLRSFPELMIIVKGLAFAIITYAFAILFKQLTEGSSVGATLFQSVPESLNTLLLPAVFGANANIINQITNGNPGLWPIIVFFMALVSVTIMYMLLGVLVDVIGAVAATEKQKIEISYIVGQLREELEKMQDFQNLVMEPAVVRVMQDAGVNVDVFADMLDLVWEDSSKQSGNITFTDLVNMVLNMRGSNPATVKDCKEQIRVTNSLMRRCFVELSDELDERFSQVRTEIQNSMDEYPDDEDITESQALQFRSYEVEVADIGRRSDAAAAAEET
ncbi:unnamed protein product [Symbiodinium microadriaticum]|nr:unnamed protein product [Symbiodinium microadriaticum]